MADSPANSTGTRCLDTTELIAVDPVVLLVIAGMLSFLALLSLIGNVITVLVIYRVAVLHKPVFVFTANIACADILMTLLNVFYTIACLVLRPSTFVFSPVLCTVQTHVSYITSTTVVCFLAVTAVYRMAQVCCHSTFERINSVKWMVLMSVLAWGVPAILSGLFSGKARYYPFRYGCYFSINPLLFILAGVMYVPMSTLFVVSYVKVMIFVRKSRRQIQVSVDEQATIDRELSVYRPVLVIFFIFMAMFIIPGIFYQMALSYGQPYKPALDLAGSLVTRMRPVFNLMAVIVTSTNFRNALWNNFRFRCIT
ncbi:alpha-1B adrenergic receptor-like [Gigantopelta aegis]|uniref:alpha-1B adrenergic receptor-like n=1 Tax=Gigantopelta aegis TaxID=1735272 RepID=UPI001B8892D3|nr:alpha-1B adrenergic receptor-like [Gigantopelta aegis]